MHPPSRRSLFATEPDQYTFVWPSQAVFEVGSAERLFGWVQRNGSRKPLVVSDVGLVAAGVVAPRLTRLRDVGLAPCLFDGGSLYDRFGSDYTPLRFNREVAVEPLLAAACERGVPLSVAGRRRRRSTRRIPPSAGALWRRPACGLAW
ncbi:hypothetical protein [Burkholderia cepacia]|uniref:hypothetical protein n=1 Tax=Burkholderia cepacia TaxID=292 RepID=UPI003D677CAC